MKRKSILLWLCLCLTGCSGLANKDGLAYLKSRDELKTADIAQKLKADRNADLKEKFKQNQVEPAAVLRNTVIIGDSRADGLSAYGVLPTSEVLAVVGISSKAIPDFKEDIEKRQPANIIWTFGINDMEANFGNQEPGAYAALIEEQMDGLLEVSPNSKIYLSSIIPATDPAFATAPGLKNVDYYNKEIQDLAKKRNWVYIDNSNIDVTKLYEDDGIHFAAEFYPLWAGNMANAVLEAGNA